MFVLIFSFPLLSAAQDCPPPNSATVYYDAYESPWESYLDWSIPDTECPIEGYMIEYATYDFVPGTGDEEGSMMVGGPIAVIPATPTPALYVYISTFCNEPCDGPFGDPDGGASSGWVLADVFIAPPPPPPCPGVDYAGNCSDPLEPEAMEDGCFPISALHFYGHCVQFNETINPCTDEEEFMIWYQYDSPPTGELIFSGAIQDLSGNVPPPESFGIVVLDQNCNGNILDCDTTLTENDSLVVSLPPGETFFVGFWLNDAEYIIDDPWEPEFNNYDLYLSVCEPEVDCAYPTDISITDVTNQSIEIEWDDSEGTSWMLEYGPQGFTPGTGTEVLVDTESPFLLEGLQPDTDYDFYMETICAQFGTNSVNIGPVEFSTFPSMTIEPIPDGHLYCCDDFFLPESAETEAFCDSIYFTHNDSIVGVGCPYTVHRTITAHDTCGNSIQTAFYYDILDNQIPCGCEAEIVVPKDEDEIQVALHGNWAVLANGDINEIYHLEEDTWIPYDTINNTHSYFIHSLGIYEEIIVETNHVYRLTEETWSFETVLEPSISGEDTIPGIVAIHENTIAYALNGIIFIFEYADGEWTEVAYFEHSTFKLDLGENVLLSAITFDDNIGRVYRKTNGTWTMEQELPNFHPDNNGYDLGRDAAINGDYAAIGYKYGGGLFTFKYNGESWEPDEFLTNPYHVNPGGGYATCFGSAVDIEGDLMVVGDYFNAVNGGASGSVAVFERTCGQWAAQRNIVPSNGTEDQRFGGCLDLQGSRMFVGVDNQYWLGGITYDGIGHYWLYECLESNPTFSIAAENEVSVECLADVPPAEFAYELGNAWCSSTEVSIEADTVGMDCDLIIIREFTATDSLGNTATATQQITVSDSEPPVVVSAPEDESFNCSAETVVEPPVFADNCSDTLEVIFSADTVINGCNISITQTWTAFDDCDNSTMVSRTVTIEDGAPEIISAPEDLDLVCGVSWEMEEPVFSDECTADLEISFAVDTISAVCPLVIEHQWTATDACGNSTTAARTIAFVDNTPPAVVSEPQDLSVWCTDDWSEDTPEFSDNCSAEIEITHVVDTIFNDGCEILIEEIWQVIDDCENTTTVVRSVSIQDETPPTITCPDDIEVILSEVGQTYVLVDLTDGIEVADNCAESVSISQSIDPGTELIGGEHTITLTASDGCNTATCDISVEVIVTTSVDDVENQHLVFYPNPSDGMISIQRQDASPLQVDVFDVRGKLILSERFSTQKFDLDLHRVAKGTYTVRLQSATYSVIEQIIIR